MGNALLVADVGHHATEDRQARSICGRHPQPRLVHQRQEPERLERDCLAARVRTRDDQRPIAEAIAEAQVDRNRRGAEQRMARGEELGRVVRRRRAHGVHPRPEPSARHPEVGTCQGRKAVAQGVTARLDFRGELVEDPLLLARGGQ